MNPDDLAIKKELPQTVSKIVAKMLDNDSKEWEKYEDEVKVICVAVLYIMYLDNITKKLEAEVKQRKQGKMILAVGVFVTLLLVSFANDIRSVIFSQPQVNHEILNKKN